MNTQIDSSQTLISTFLPFPDGGQVEVDVPADFLLLFQETIRHIISTYGELKNQFTGRIEDGRFEDQVMVAEQLAYERLPEVDHDQRFNILYLYTTFWLSLKMETDIHFSYPVANQSGSKDLKANWQRLQQDPNDPDEFPESLKRFIAHTLSRIIVYELNPHIDEVVDPRATTPLTPEPLLNKKKLAVPNAFPKGIAVVPNNPVVAAGLRAIFKGGPNARKLIGGWTQLGEQVFYRQIHKSGRGEIRYYPNILPASAKVHINVESLWECVENLNPFTADVALAILAQLCEPSTGIKPKFPLRESVLINANAIMRYKGIRKYGKDRRIMEKRIHTEVERLRTLHFDMERYPLPWDKKGTKYLGDRLFDIVKVETYQLKLFSKKEIVETAWSVRAGQWAEHFFNTELERVWTSRMAKALIELDHRNQRKTAQLAKKIGYLLLTVPGGTAHRNHPVTRRIDRILEQIGELPVPEFRTKDWAGRLRDGLLKAWDILLSAGLIKKLKFPDGYGFDDTDRTKGWVETWLSSKVIITTPEAAPEPSQKEIEAFRKKQFPRNKKAKRLISKKIRRKPQAIQLEVCSPKYRKKIRNACQEQYISQRTLAKIVGIAPSTLSNILRGHDLPSLRLAQKIDSWLESGESS